MKKLILECGCAANSKVHTKGGITFNPPLDGCAIHDCITPAEVQPNLENRLAECTCGKTDDPRSRCGRRHEYSAARAKRVAHCDIRKTKNG